jgi:GxxExxY protein
MIHSELSEKVIGAAMRVLNELKPGLDEKIYENALVLELREAGLSVDQQANSMSITKASRLGCSSQI